MTDGEKMVWAAAFALGFQRAQHDSVEQSEHGRRAALLADAAVNALRFGAPEGDYRNEMLAVRLDDLFGR